MLIEKSLPFIGIRIHGLSEKLGKVFESEGRCSDCMLQFYICSHLITFRPKIKLYGFNFEIIYDGLGKGMIVDAFGIKIRPKPSVKYKGDPEK